MPGASKAGAKRETVAHLTEAMRGATATVLTEYRGLSMAELTELRRALGTGTSYEVVKNTLTAIAARDAGVDGLEALLAGPTAVAFVSGDPVEAAKALRAFGRDHPFLVVKGGVMDGKPLTAPEIARLADLESREVLLAKLAGALEASLTNAARLFAAPLSQAARVIEALRAKAEADPSVLAAGAGAPTADTTAPEAAGTDAPSAATPTASELPAVTLTTDEAAQVEAGGPAPAGNADATDEAPDLPETAEDPAPGG